MNLSEGNPQRVMTLLRADGPGMLLTESP